MNLAAFMRQRVRIETRFPKGRKRNIAMQHLVVDANAVPVFVSGRITGWTMQDGRMVCVKHRYRTDAEAHTDLLRILAGKPMGRVPKRFYPCAQCGGWHLTSQERKPA